MKNERGYPQTDEMDFEWFYREHVSSLRKYIRYRVADREACDDLVAETMCQMLAYCRRESDVTMHRALLFKIARNRLADYYEQSKVKKREVPVEDAPPLPAPGSITAMIDADADLQATFEELSKLREEDREIITLHAFVGLSMSELAEMMELSTGAVRVRLFRARRALRRRLGRRGDGESGANV